MNGFFGRDIIGIPAYRDINLSGAALTPVGATAPDLVDFVNSNLKVFAFDGNNTIERLYGSLEMQHDYFEGTDVEVHVHWAPTTANAGNVVWKMYISWGQKDELFPVPTLLTAAPVAAGGTAWEAKYSELGMLPGAGKIINSQFVLHLFRDPTDPADTYPDDAALVQIGIHYRVNSLGSRQMRTK